LLDTRSTSAAFAHTTEPAMTVLKISLSAIALTALAAVLVSCGGGGGESSSAAPAAATPASAPAGAPADTSAALPPPPAPTAKAEGLYSGTLTDADATNFQLVVLEDGSYWAIPGNVVDDTFYVTGLEQGSGAVRTGSLSSSNERDFDGAQATAGTLSASYDDTADNITGTVVASGGATIGFSGSKIASTGYVYDQPATLSSITGDWDFSATAFKPTSLHINANGSFTGATSNDCLISGKIVPRSSGKNVFNVSLTLGAAPCHHPGLTGHGIALAIPQNSGETELLVAVADPSRTYGVVAGGVR
jgi:hypothetical protein